MRWRTHRRDEVAGGEDFSAMADSGIRRSVAGSTWFESCVDGVSRFGRARAQESRVDRLARSAAS